MKRFLVFVIICIVTLSLGLTTYYFLRDNEVILVQDSYFEVNKGDVFTVGVDITNKKPTTEIIHESLHPSIVDYNPVSKGFEAYSGGRAIIRISATRSDFKPVMIEVIVGDGTENAPYFIRTPEDLMEIGTSELKSMDRAYILKSDINMATFNNGVFVPIGNDMAPGERFNGYFDFNNHTISNLNIVQSQLPQGVTVNNAGLFSVLEENAIVKNLILQDTIIEGSFQNIGAVAGINYGTIERVIVSGGQLTNLLFASSTGGIVGRQEIIGTKRPRVDIAYTNIIINSRQIGAGLVGFNYGGIVISSYSGSTVIGEIDSFIGGLVGFNHFKTIGSSHFGAYVKDAYFYGAMSGVGATIGALIADNLDRVQSVNIIRGLYYSKEISGDITAIGGVTNESINTAEIGVYERTLEELRNPTTYYSYKDWQQSNISWSFTKTWYISPTYNNGLPTLNMAGPKVDDGFRDMFIQGEIRDASSLIAMGMDDEIIYVIKQDIDLSSIQNWTPIGTQSTPFNGKLVAEYDAVLGRYYRISGLNIIQNNEANGLFGYVGSQGVLENIFLYDVNITAGENVGALVGINHGIIKGAKAINPEPSDRFIVSENANGELNVGGLVGRNHGTISESSTKLKISITSSAGQQSNLGGIVGSNAHIIIDSHSTSNLVATGGHTQYIGGIAGHNAHSLEKVYFMGNITAEISSDKIIVGGLAGFVDTTATIKFSFVASGLYQGHSVGALVGTSRGTVTESYADIVNIKARYAGGLAFNIASGKFENTYTLAYMMGIDKNSVKAGFAYFIDYQSSTSYGEVVKSFSAATFDVVGRNFAETFAPIRNEGLLIVKRQAGYVRNSIFDAQYQALERQNFTSLFNWQFVIPVEDREISVTTEHATGEDLKGFSTFLENKFSSIIWRFEAGNYPQLRRALTLPE